METVTTQPESTTNLWEDKTQPLPTRILALLQAKGPMARDSLVTFLTEARTTIYDSLRKLMANNLVARKPNRDWNGGKRGRPVVLFYIP